MPFAVGLLTAEGEELPLQLEGETEGVTGTRLLVMEEASQVYTFVNIPEAPVPSLFRDFSAPVKIIFDYFIVFHFLEIGENFLIGPTFITHRTGMRRNVWQRMPS